MNGSNRNLSSLDSNTYSADSTDYSALFATITLGGVTGLGLEFISYFFKLDRDVSQILLYPFVLIAFCFLLKRSLPKAVIVSLLLTIPLLILGKYWAEGGFTVRKNAFISSSVLSHEATAIENFRFEYNRDAELHNFSTFGTLHRGFTDQSAESWGKGRGAVLIYGSSKAPKIKVFFRSFQIQPVIKFDDFDLQIGIFPELLEMDTKGIPIEYVEELARAVGNLKESNSNEENLEILEFAGLSAGQTSGLWRSLTPRASALLLAASSKLAIGVSQETQELKYIQKQLAAAVKKVNKGSPYFRALALNNLAVSQLAIYAKRGLFPTRTILTARKLFAKASVMRTSTGEIVEGARLATRNLFALDGAGLGPIRFTRHRVTSIGGRERRRVIDTKAPATNSTSSKIIRARRIPKYTPSNLVFPAGAFTKSGSIENYGEQNNLFS